MSTAMAEHLRVQFRAAVKPRSLLERLGGKTAPAVGEFKALAPTDAVAIWDGTMTLQSFSKNAREVVIESTAFRMAEPDVPASLLGIDGWDAAQASPDPSPIDLVGANAEARRAHACATPVTDGVIAVIRPCTLPGAFGAFTAHETEAGEAPMLTRPLTLGELAERQDVLMPGILGMAAYGGHAAPCLFVECDGGTQTRKDVVTGRQLMGELIALQLGRPDSPVAALMAYRSFREAVYDKTGKEVGAVYVTWSSQAGFKAPAQIGAPGLLGEWIEPVRVFINDAQRKAARVV